MKPGSLRDIQRLQAELWEIASTTTGYISGETVFSADNPDSFMTVSRWESIDYWWAWENNAQRRSLFEKYSGIMEVTRSPRIWRTTQ
jgi:antibiotic biosynthesis monooxygenase (ABM) superfamily enzyme